MSEGQKIDPRRLYFECIIHTMDDAERRGLRWKDFGKALLWANEEIERLRAAIMDAPHDSFCSSVGHGPASETNPCDCWKRKALEGE
jgi:hypothetical protein